MAKSGCRLFGIVFVGVSEFRVGFQLATESWLVKDFSKPRISVSVEVVLDSSSTWEQFIVTAEDESVSRAYYVDPCLFVFTESVPNEGISKIVKISKSDWYKHVEENGYYRDGDYHRYDYSCHIREYQEADAEQLQLAADHAAIASRLRPGFPSPYTLADARGWIQLVRDDQAFAGRTFAVIVGGAIAGGVGLVPVPEIQLGEEDRAHGEELGYWITPACWGQGVGSSAVAQFVALVQSGGVNLKAGCDRLLALPAIENIASCQVLEKSGFVKDDAAVLEVETNGGLVQSLVFRLELVPPS